MPGTNRFRAIEQSNTLLATRQLEGTRANRRAGRKSRKLCGELSPRATKSQRRARSFIRIAIAGCTLAEADEKVKKGRRRREKKRRGGFGEGGGRRENSG